MGGPSRGVEATWVMHISERIGQGVRSHGGWCTSEGGSGGEVGSCRGGVCHACIGGSIGGRTGMHWWEDQAGGGKPQGWHALTGGSGRGGKLQGWRVLWGGNPQAGGSTTKLFLSSQIAPKLQREVIQVEPILAQFVST